VSSFCGIKGRLNLASHFGVSIRRFFSAGQHGKFIQQVLEKEFKAKKRKVKHVYSVDL
jgi:hypothetical protein